MPQILPMIPRIETWLRVLESFREILKPVLKLDKVKVEAGLVFGAFAAHGPIGQQALF